MRTVHATPLILTPHGLLLKQEVFDTLHTRSDALRTKPRRVSTSTFTARRPLEAEVGTLDLALRLAVLPEDDALDLMLAQIVAKPLERTRAFADYLR